MRRNYVIYLIINYIIDNAFGGVFFIKRCRFMKNQYYNMDLQFRSIHVEPEPPDPPASELLGVLTILFSLILDQLSAFCGFHSGNNLFHIVVVGRTACPGILVLQGNIIDASLDAATVEGNLLAVSILEDRIRTG